MSIGLNIIWEMGATCSGDSMSLINGYQPDFFEFIERFNLNLKYHPTLSPESGEDAQRILKAAASGEDPADILIIEGSIPLGPDKDGSSILSMGRPVKDVIKDMAKHAGIVIAAGTCAAYGGIPGTPPNPSNVVGLQFDDEKIGGLLGKDFTSQMGLPVINIPGCPVHPQWLLNSLITLVYREFSLDMLDEYNRPRFFFTDVAHRGCRRCEHFEYAVWADTYSSVGCLESRLGCKGRTAHGDCNIRLWNNQSSCTRAGSPCIGCTHPKFPEGQMPFERIINERDLPIPDRILQEIRRGDI